jgi:hypothetical protein
MLKTSFWSIHFYKRCFFVLKQEKSTYITEQIGSIHFVYILNQVENY